MQEKKIISIDLEILKEKAVQSAQHTGEAVLAKISAFGKSASERAKLQRDITAQLLLAKGIELSRRQLKALEDARQSYG